MKQIRQPIVTVCGHVDHGKTSILDCFRQSCVQEGEAGGITQKISFTLYPIEKLKLACPLIEKSNIKLDIPGFLFIDTPGHAAFTNLRKRGGSLADLAVLVIDINEGIKPQTAEVIQILKKNKTPFIIALNKIDNISGWRKQNENLRKSVESQTQNVKNIFDEKYMTLMGSLNSHGFDSDIFYNIKDFTKKIALIPCSARTKEGIPELIMMLCGLSQKYLENKLELGKNAKGVMLEVKKEKSQHYIEAILYDGELSKKDILAVANLEGEPTITKIRVLEEIQPLCSTFKPIEKAQASTGIRMQFVEKTEILPGMPFVIYNDNKEEIVNLFKKELTENIQTQKQGIIAKADSLGSLEALLSMLKDNKIPVIYAGIGSINKTDISNAKANLEINPINSVVLGFNIPVEEDITIASQKVNIITGDVIYKLIENLLEFREEKRKEMEKVRLLGLSSLCKLELLKQYIFRNTNPAIFGTAVSGGKLIRGLYMINNSGEKIGKIKNIQSENTSVDSATEGMEVAISVPGINYERKLKTVDSLYSDITETQFRNFKKNKDLLSASELRILQEIAEIKRQKKANWGV